MNYKYLNREIIEIPKNIHNKGFQTLVLNNVAHLQKLLCYQAVIVMLHESLIISTICVGNVLFLYRRDFVTHKINALGDFVRTIRPAV